MVRYVELDIVHIPPVSSHHQMFDLHHLECDSVKIGGIQIVRCEPRSFFNVSNGMKLSRRPKYEAIVRSI